MFQIIKSVLLKQFKDDDNDEVITTLKPIDSAMFMTAFCRVGIFDVELFEVLEGAFIKKIDEA